MVKDKSRKEKSSPKMVKTTQSSTIHFQDVIETIQNSILDITNEIAKFQPQYAQSVSNFQGEYLEASKRIIQNVSDLQSTFLESNWTSFDDRSASYAKQISNQLNELAQNIVKTYKMWNQIALNSIDISKENIKMCTQAMTSLESYNRDMISSWNSFLISPFGK